jgi:hypothetical protein
MNRPDFESVIKQKISAQPFVPFVVELLTGERVSIEDPKAFRCQGGAAAYAPIDGQLDIFDYRSVRAVEVLVPASIRSK